MTKAFNRLTLVIEHKPEETKGIARSIVESHIAEALDQCTDLLGALWWSRGGRRVYSLELNEWNGERQMQFNLKDWRSTQEATSD